MAASYNTCEACDGYGLVKNVETAALAALRKLQTRGVRSDVGRIRVGLPADVATWLANHKREEVLRIERRQGIQIDIVPVATLLRHESEFESIARPPQEAATEEIKAAMSRRPADEGKSEDTRKPDDIRKAGQARTDDQRLRATGRRPDAVELDRKDETEAPVAVAIPPAPRPTPIRPVTEEDDPVQAEPAWNDLPDSDETGTGEVQRAEEANAAETAPTDDSGKAETEAATRDAEAKSRRRRRRKRRPKSSQGPRTDSPNPEPKPERVDDVPSVPRGIKVDELMPAASGSAEGQNSSGRSGSSRSGSRSSNGRRKRRPAGSGRV
jgi:ribonuclease E